MLLNTSDVLTARLTAINAATIFAETENGALIKIVPNQKQRTDPLFWESIRAILHAKLWVPVSKMRHQLLDTDWLEALPVD